MDWNENQGLRRLKQNKKEQIIKYYELKYTNTSRKEKGKGMKRRGGREWRKGREEERGSKIILKEPETSLCSQSHHAFPNHPIFPTLPST